jgi:hypothetical protein
MIGAINLARGHPTTDNRVFPDSQSPEVWPAALPLIQKVLIPEMVLKHVALLVSMISVLFGHPSRAVGAEPVRQIGIHVLPYYEAAQEPERSREWRFTRLSTACSPRTGARTL